MQISFKCKNNLHDIRQRRAGESGRERERERDRYSLKDNGSMTCLRKSPIINFATKSKQHSNFSDDKKTFKQGTLTKGKVSLNKITPEL